MSILKQQVSFFSNFASFFSVMRQNLYIFSWNFIYFQQKEHIKVQIWWSFTWAVKNLKFSTLIDFFCPNHLKFQLKKYQRVTSDDNEEWCKLLKKLAYGFKYDMRNLVNFHPSTQKSENLFWMGSFCPKYTRLELHIYRGFVFQNTEQWCSENSDHVVSNMTWVIWWNLPEHSKILKFALWETFLSTVYNIWAKKLERG